jgi:ureidoacrylate peracid hydrolase
MIAATSPQDAHEKKATYLPKNETGTSFPIDRTALLVIDPVNDFLSEGGAAWELTKNTVKMNNVVENLKRVVEAARASGMLVLFGPMAYTEEDYADEQLQKKSGINRLMFERKMFLAGSWGADFHPELKPQTTDIVLLPHKSCDVFLTDLPTHLEKRNVTHLVIAGMTANLCCESTGRHAMEAGYDVTFISDAIGASGVPAYEAAIQVNFPLIANAVIKTEEFIKAIGSRPEHVEIQKGDKVRGSDHGEIGTVDKVVPAAPDTEAHLLVPHGLIFKTDLYIPMDAVVKRIGSEVIVNIPKMVVEAMPWTEPPTRKKQVEKLGPNSQSVGNLYGSRSPSIQEQAPGSGTPGYQSNSSTPSGV